MGIDKQSNFLDKNMVRKRVQEIKDSAERGMEASKSDGDKYRKFAKKSSDATRRLKTIHSNIENSPKRALKGVLKRSGKVLRKAFLRI